MNENISVIVIGGGPGGYVAAIKAAQLGATVTLVEKRRLGGTCLNVGCIPTKSLLHAADVLESVKNAAASGILAGEPQFDWNKIQENRVNVVSQMVKGVESLVKSNKITVVEGAGSFVDGKTVKVTAADDDDYRNVFIHVSIPSIVFSRRLPPPCGSCPVMEKEAEGGCPSASVMT